MTVEPIAEQVEQRHHRHVEEEEAQQASGAEVSEEGIHPNSHHQINPQDPEESTSRGGTKMFFTEQPESFPFSFSFSFDLSDSSGLTFACHHWLESTHQPSCVNFNLL